MPVRTFLLLITLLGVGTATLHLDPVPAFAEYLITLKAGGGYQTSEYWTEGQEVRFYVCGGMVGVPHRDIAAVTEVTQPALSHRQANGCLAPRLVPQLVESDQAEVEPTVTPEGTQPAPSPKFRKHANQVRKFERRLGDARGKSREDLMTFVTEGQALQQTILTESEPQDLNPLLTPLFQSFEQIEEALYDQE